MSLSDSQLVFHASLLANERRHRFVKPIHVLLAATYRGNDTALVLMDFGIDLRGLRTECRRRMESIETGRGREVSTAMALLLDRAAKELQHGLSNELALLVSLGDDEECGEIMASNFVTTSDLREAAKVRNVR